MTDPILYVDRSEIREGKLEELKTAVDELVEMVEANEPRAIAYNAYRDAESRRMTVIHVHPDSASLEFHMKVAGPAFPRFKELIELSSIEIYGTPSESLRDQLRQKVQLLGSGSVAVHERQAGFARFERP